MLYPIFFQVISSIYIYYIYIISQLMVGIYPIFPPQLSRLTDPAQVARLIRLQEHWSLRLKEVTRGTRGMAHFVVFLDSELPSGRLT